ncbi:cell division protein FtsZ, partial [Listeria monocytogenes]|nr:cell division protein FtsZ [Listeria monocytogenes]
NITGGSNLSLYELQEAAEIVSSASDEDVNMIFGYVINDELKDELIVTVISTGFDEAKQAQQQAQANRRPNQSIQVNRPNYAVQD